LFPARDQCFLSVAEGRRGEGLKTTGRALVPMQPALELNRTGFAGGLIV
jgi:hypothetical protein